LFGKTNLSGKRPQTCATLVKEKEAPNMTQEKAQHRQKAHAGKGLCFRSAGLLGTSEGVGRIRKT